MILGDNFFYGQSLSKALMKGTSLKKGAKIQNGYKMLKYQAEKSWELWNKI